MKRRPRRRTRSVFASWSFWVSVLLAFSLFYLFVRPGEKPGRGKEAPLERRTAMSEERAGEWGRMVSAIKKHAMTYRGYVGIYLKDLGSGEIFKYRPDNLFPSASLIKVPIMAAVFHKIKKGDISFDTMITLTSKNRKGGSGTLKWIKAGTGLSVMELLYKMITESDNTAANMLIDRVGMEFLQNQFKKMGLERTNITREGMSLTSRRVARENYTTPREMALLLEKIYRGKLVDEESSELMLEFLKHNKSRTRLRRGIPIGWEVGHKTGLLRRSCHDAGIVFSPGGDYILVVLTSEVPSYSSAKKLISNIAKETTRFYDKSMRLAGNPLEKNPM